jgi:SAM-dependent methyltransferase
VSSPNVYTSLKAVHEILSSRFSGRKIRIYEAGGGSLTFMPPDVLRDGDVTVLDIDQAQLDNNRYAHKKILGDVQTYAFPKDSFELIVCYNVVEHLDAPDRAIELFSKALAPGGLLLIGAPVRNSFSGWVTRLTPHWFHVWYYRHMLGRTHAGEPGHGPFRTIYHPVVAPAALLDYCRKLGFQVVYFQEYQGDLLRLMTESRPVLGRLLGAAISAANILTLWRRDLKNGDFHLILEKPGAPANARHAPIDTRVREAT